MKMGKKSKQTRKIEARSAAAQIEQKLPNPRLNAGPNGCHHGCQIATPGSISYEALYWIISDLNIFVDKVGSECNAQELNHFVVQSARQKVKYLDELLRGQGVDRGQVLVSNLVLVGTDCLLMKGVCKQAQLKMACVIAGIVKRIELQHSIDVRSKKSLVDYIRNVRDIFGFGEGQIVGFFNKRVGCNCLKGRYEAVRNQAKTGSCDHCRKTFELKRLMHCRECNTAQYCSKLCQKNDWTMHRTTCKSIKRSFVENFALKFTELAFIEKEETGTEQSEAEIIERLQAEALKDPTYCEKYGHWSEEVISCAEKMNNEYSNGII